MLFSIKTYRIKQNYIVHDYFCVASMKMSLHVCNVLGEKNKMKTLYVFCSHLTHLLVIFQSFKIKK